MTLEGKKPWVTRESFILHFLSVSWSRYYRCLGTFTPSYTRAAWASEHCYKMLPSLKSPSVHEEVSVSAKCKDFFLKEKAIFLKQFFYFEERSEHFFTKGLENWGEETFPCSHSWMTIFKKHFWIDVFLFQMHYCCKFMWERIWLAWSGADLETVFSRWPLWSLLKVL